MNSSISAEVPADITAGLESEHGSELSAVLHRWFVRYNPLYIASALLILAGVYTLGDAMHEGGVPWVAGRLALATVTQGYELALIAAAAFLMRRGLRRPAVMLALIAAVFFFDAAFHLEALAHTEPWDSAAVLLFLGFCGLKLALWQRVLRLRFSAGALAIVLGGAVVVGVAPWLFDSGLVNPRVLLQAIVWLLAILGVGVWFFKPRITTELSLDGEGIEMLQSIERFLYALIAVSLGGRLVFWETTHRLDLVDCLWLPGAWVLVSIAGSTTLAAALSVPLFFYVLGEPTVVIVPVILGTVAILVGQARRLRQPDRLTLALVWLAVATNHVWPELDPKWIGVAMIGVLVVMAWRWRLPSAAGLAVIGTAVGLGRVEWHPSSLGVGLLLAGFATLGLGVWTSLRQGEMASPNEPEAESEPGPIDSR